MYHHQGRYYSSFMPIVDHPTGITEGLHIVTVRSGGSGTGGHVSVYLEGTEALAPGCYSTYLLHLIAAEGSMEPVIRVEHVQLTNLAGQFVKDSLDAKRGPAELLQTYHTCYQVTGQQSKGLLTAARRFQQKALNGRYEYHQGGGIRASISTAFKPGVRGVNCGDFVIKILKEAGIASIPRKYTSEPIRVASGH